MRTARRGWPLGIAGLALGLAALGAPPAAQATSRIDGIEHIFGATNVNAVAGHGYTTAGLSAEGDLTVLVWPNPSFADQLGYLSSNAIDARGQVRLGAPEGAGSFLGLVVGRDGERAVHWLRDRSVWDIEQSYSPAGANVLTHYAGADLGLEVDVTDAVRPGRDGPLIRLVEVRSVQPAPEGLWLLTYANLSPTPPNSRIPEVPVIDWAFDGSNDYAAIWLDDVGGVMHFHPQDQLVWDDLGDLLSPPRALFGPIGAALAEGPVDQAQVRELAATLETSYAAGAWLLLTTRPRPASFQVGYDRTPLCAMRDLLADNIVALPQVFPDLSSPIDPAVTDIFRCADPRPVFERLGWRHTADDAWEDAGDGFLGQSPVAAGEVNEALLTPLDPVPEGDGWAARAAVIFSPGATAADAISGAQAVAEPRRIAEEAEEAVTAWLEGVALPQSLPPRVRAVARRALLNLRVGTDAETGAIVASPSRQPPYGLDWPRDGAFFNAALEVAGLSELAGRRADLYLQWQRAEPALPVPVLDQPPPVDPSTGRSDTYPAGAWEMNYYPDGMTGGIFRFEIDNTAFALWLVLAHVGALPPAEVPSYLQQRWTPIERAAALLARWRDPATGLQAPAQEDDNPGYTQTLHGAVTVFGALDLAARAARAAGKEREARDWGFRACELRSAILDLLYDEEAGRFTMDPGRPFDPARAPLGPGAWLVWPMRVLPWDDPRIRPEVLGQLDAIEPTVALQTEGGSYFMKNTASAALAFGSDPVIGPRVRAMLETIAERHATPDTLHFGEVVIFDGPSEARVASQRVATPHLWEGILFYLTAMALEQPERFDRHLDVLPPSPAPPAGAPCSHAYPCPGDCDGDRRSAIAELIRGVRIALGLAPGAACVAADADGDGVVDVSDLTAAVDAAANGCPL